MPDVMNEEVEALLDQCEAFEELQPRELLALAERALLIAREQDKKMAIARALRSRGRALMLLGETRPSVDSMSEALTLFEELNVPPQIAGIHGFLGVLYQSRAEFGLALRHFGTALQLFVELKNENAIASTYLNIGNIHYAMEHLDLAMQQYRKAMQIYESTHQEQGVGICLVNLRDINTRRGEHELGLHYSQRALDIFQRLRLPLNIALTHCALACTYRFKGEYSNAKLEISAAVDISEREGYQAVLGRAILESGRLHFAEGDLDRALECYQQARQIAQQLENRYLEIDALEELCTLEMSQGRQEQLEAYREQLQAIDGYRARNR